MSIVSEAPKWFILLCVLAGLVYAGALYFRDRFNRTYGSRLAALLGFFRLVVVSLLAFFLLKPLIKNISNDLQKPIIVIAQDDSESLVVGKDSSYYKGEYQQQLQSLIASFGNDYEIRTYHFGAQVAEGIDSLRFDEKLTDFSTLLDEVYNKYSGSNIGALIVASDGLYNRGENPVYSFRKLGCPVYTVALGDTTVHKDVLLAEVAHNRIAYLGNKFPVEITVEGRKAAGENSTLTVSRKGQVLHSEQIQFTGERFFKTISLSLDAKETGLQKYTVSLTTVKNEITTTNNRKDIFIDVLDGRQKVLILASAPHPDVAAIKDALLINESYQVEAELEKDFSGNLSEYSLVIFHQLPAVGGTGLSIISNTLDSGIPAVFVWGANTDFRAFNDLNTGYALNDYRNSTTDVGGIFSKEFSLFSMNESTAENMRKLPPLSVPFGDFEFSQGVSALAYQRVGQIETDNPLISFNKVGEHKVGLIAGEGLWRWRLTSFQNTQAHDEFSEIVTKMVQYMASKEDRSLFRVNAKNDFLENEHVIFEAELYNESYEPITNREISITIVNEEGNEFRYNFSPTGTRYRLDAGQLPPGNYSYNAQANNGAQLLKEVGEFSVTPLQLETVNTVADHRLLNQFAVENNGEMVLPADMNSLAEKIKARKDIVAIAYENKQLTDIIDYRWLLAVLLGFLCLEWLLRKRAGTY
ncbi:MAG: hypothetical protein SH856_05425 [Flavobacteriales bacterium]|nr:hypothetical protein [Flavobacteriales bacterium]